VIDHLYIDFFFSLVDKEYTPPPSINKRAIAVAFTKVGVKKVVGFASVGGMHTELHPGLVLIPDDYFNPWAVMNLFDNKETALSESPFSLWG